MTVVDSGASRAAWIPVSHNLAGFPDGLSGDALLQRLRQQALQFGATLLAGEVETLTPLPKGGFEAVLGGNALLARRVLLASGGLDVEPELPGVREAVRRGLVRYCPICDAYEVIGQQVALIAFGKCRIEEALLLRAYTAHLTILTLGQEMEMADAERRTLAEAGIAILDTPVTSLLLEGDRIATWQMEDRSERTFDTIYSALGTRIRSGLATALGAEADEDGALLVDRQQRTTVADLYAAGDVVSGLSQISVASGQAAIAATHINRSLPFPKP